MRDHSCVQLIGTGDAAVLLPAILRIVVDDLRDEALALWVGHIDAGELGGVHAQIVICGHSATLHPRLHRQVLPQDGRRCEYG